MPNYVKKMIPTAVILVLDIIAFLMIPSQVKVLTEGLVNTRFMPYFVTILIAICGVVDLVQTFFKERNSNENQEKKRYFDKKGLIRVLVCCLCVAVYLVIMPYLGFVLSTILLYVVVTLLMGSRNWIGILILSVVLTMVVYCVFKLGLSLRLPTGLFFF